MSNADNAWFADKAPTLKGEGCVFFQCTCTLGGIGATFLLLAIEVGLEYCTHKLTRAACLLSQVGGRQEPTCLEVSFLSTCTAYRRLRTTDQTGETRVIVRAAT